MLDYVRDVPGVPAPTVVVADPGQPPEQPPLFVMSEAAGDAGDPWWAGDPVVPGPLVADRAAEMMRVLGALHRLPVSRVPGDIEAPVLPSDEVNRWRAVFGALDDRAFAAAAEPLYERLIGSVPAPATLCLTHGDYRFGNLVFDGAAVSGVIDWELWAVSDPRFDVANVLLYTSPESALCLRDSTPHPDPAVLVQTYEQAAGYIVSDLEWFMGALRYKSAAALGLLVRNNRRSQRRDPLMDQVAERIPSLLAIRPG
jgi:aminoglycoside phosphotransferase (APT) family kinase protein